MKEIIGLDPQEFSDSQTLAQLNLSTDVLQLNFFIDTFEIPSLGKGYRWI